MKNFAILLFLLCAVLVFGQTKTPSAPITRVYNEAGWTIPGLKNAHVMHGTTPHEANEIIGIAYQITNLEPTDKTNARVPFVWLDSPKQRYSFREREVRAQRITAYEVNSRPYCYRVEVMFFDHNPETKTGGWSGSLDLWYYDETGTGRWTIMDTAGPTVPTGQLLPHVPLPPAWAKGRGQ